MTSAAGPETRPVFFGDDWQELRDAQADCRLEGIERLAGRIGEFHLSAATVAGQAEDPVVAFSVGDGPSTRTSSATRTTTLPAIGA